MKLFWRKNSKEILFLFLVLIAFSFLHLYKLADVSTTWDEGADVGIVYCYVESKDLFGCMDDVSQTRLPYYIHAAVIAVTNDFFGKIVNYYISFGFGLFILGYFYWFVRREFSKKIALFSTLLLLFSIPQLAMSRMLLTHSNIIFTAWVVLSMTSFYFALKSGKKLPFTLAAIFWGLAISSSILGVFLFIFFLAFVLMIKRPNPKSLMHALFFVSVAAAAFFISSICYTSQQNLMAFIDNIRENRAELYPYWNYLGLGSPQSPWWFSWLLFGIKFTPWWTAMLGVSIALFIKKRNHLRLNEYFLVAAIIFLFVYFILKSAVFKYDAPHHQAPYYPFIYVAVAYGIVYLFDRLKNTKQIAIGMIIGLFFSLQIVDVIRFFPNYLFYGAQYGKQFIGEFYGPAVLHCYDQYPVNTMIIKLNELGYTVLAPNHSCMRLPQKYFTLFTDRKPNEKHYFAFTDYIYMNHFKEEGSEEYKKFIAEHCRPYYAYNFPTNVPVYQLLECGQ